MKSLFLRGTLSTSCLLLVFLAAAVWVTAPLRPPASVMALNSDAWCQAMALRLSRSDLLRYILLPVTTATDQPLNIGSDGAEVRSASAVPTTCQSHQPGLAAFRLDDQPLESPVFDMTQDFTVEGWFRWHGRGSVVGANNGSAGTLLSMGDGIHDGFSLTLMFDDGSVQLGLGQPAPKASFLTQGNVRIPPGLWAHLAVVRHARQVKLYVNGLLVGLNESDVSATQPPRCRKFRVGYVGNGDSSVRMDVGEWAVFKTALQDADLARLAHLPDVPATRQLQTAREALCRADTSECQQLLQGIAAVGELSCAVKFTAAEILLRQQQADAALVAFEDVAKCGAGYWQQSARLEAMVLQSGGDRNFTAAVEKWTASHSLAEQDLLASEFASQVLPVLRGHCAECHGGELWCQAETKNTIDQIRSKKVWASVEAQLQSGNMPPQGCPPLPIELRRRVLHWIRQLAPPDPCEQQLTEARRRRLSPLAAVGRRLTQTEFSVSLQQLLAVAPRADLLPPPEGAGGEGFDTAAGTLVMSASTAELFFSCVREAVNRAIHEPGAATADPADAAPVSAVLRALAGTDSEVIAALRGFVRRAWRGALTEPDWLRLLALRQQLLEDGLTAQQAVAELLQAVLLSPAFLYILEKSPQPPADFRLSQHELAARMALFLWSGIPDELLLEAADQNRLQTEQQIRSEVQRMLRHPLADNLGRSFGLQWLGIQQLQNSRKDPLQFPEYSSEIAGLMQEEAWRLVAGVFREDRPLEELLVADYVWVNSRLAGYYGLQFPQDAAGWQSVSSGDSRRGGVLTLGAVMVVGSYPTRTSPVLRGRWILDRILGERVLPAPADVPALEKTVSTHQQMTLRQQMELHRASPTCRVCHEAMDPLGFALEEFDAVGQYRAVRDGAVMDVAARLPDGTAVLGAHGLRQEILRRRSLWLPNLVRKLTGYAAGRELFESEQCLLEEIAARTTANGGSGSSLICSILLSDIFRLRRITAESGSLQSK